MYVVLGYLFIVIYQNVSYFSAFLCGSCVISNRRSSFLRWKNTTPFHGWTSGSPPCFSASRKPYRTRRVTSADSPSPARPQTSTTSDLHPSLFFLPWASHLHSSSNLDFFWPVSPLYSFTDTVFVSHHLQYFVSCLFKSAPKKKKKKDYGLFIGFNTIFLSVHCTQYVSCIFVMIHTGIGPILVIIFIIGFNTSYSYQHTYIRRFYLMFLVIKTDERMPIY